MKNFIDRLIVAIEMRDSYFIVTNKEQVKEFRDEISCSGNSRKCSNIKCPIKSYCKNNSETRIAIISITK